MHSFLKGIKHWSNVNEGFLKPIKSYTEFDKAFYNRFHQNLTWFQSTTTPSSSVLSGPFDDSKSAWDIFLSRYFSIDGSRAYHFMFDLYQIK